VDPQIMDISAVVTEWPCCLK